MFIRRILFYFIVTMFMLTFSAHTAFALSAEFVGIENGDRFESCANILLQAQVDKGEDDTDIKRVQFYRVGKTLKTLRTEPWEYTWEGVADGIYEIYIKVTNKYNEYAFSDTIQVFVGDVADGECLYNGEFACGPDPWELNLNGDAEAVFLIEPEGWLSAEPAMAMIEIDNPGTENWHVMLIQPMPIDSGHVYEFSFIAEVDAPKQIAIDLQSTTGDFAVNQWITVDLDPSIYEYGPFVWESTITDHSNEFKLPLSIDKTSVYIDAIKAIDKNWVKNTTGVADESASVVTGYELYQNYPNPFNPSTEIDFELPQADHVNVSVYNVQGQKVATLLDDHLNAGAHTITWNAVDSHGLQLSSGVYLYTLVTENFEMSKRMLLIK